MRRTGNFGSASINAGLVGLLALSGCGGSGGGSTTVIDAAVTTDGGGGTIALDMSTDGATGGTTGDAGPTTDALTPDAAGADQGVPPCPEGSGFGYIAAPTALTSGAKANHSPRSVWNGSEFAAVWLSVGEGELGSVKFQRFNINGQPVGSLQDLGLAKIPRYDVAWNGGGYVVTYLGAKSMEGEGYTGLRVVSLGADGTPLDVPADLPATSDADRVAIGFAPLSGGMLVYSNGRNGADGIYAQPLDEGGGKVGAPQHLASTAANNPAVAFGNGSWGVAWTEPTGTAPNQLVFKLIDDHGVAVPNGRAPLQPDSGARGPVDLVYGNQDTFGLAWSHVDEMGGIKPKLTLISGTDASVEAQPDVLGPEGYGIVTDLAWHDPDFFGVAWQDNNGAAQKVGITRVNPVGVAQEPFAIVAPGTGATGGLSAAGTVSNLGAFYTLDPTPSSAGFSDAAQVYLSRLGACHR